MSKFSYILLSLLTISILLIACRKDPSNNSQYDGTLYPYDAVRFFPKTILAPDDNPLTQAKVDLGRRLFYDETVSKSKTTSCATCHSQEFGFTDNNNVLSTNDLGNVTKRNSSPLVNLAWATKGFFWDGRVMTLEEAVDDAVNNEQHPEWDATISYLTDNADYKVAFAKAFENAAIDQENFNKAVASFMRTIISKDSKFDYFYTQRISGITLTPLEQYGYDSLFTTEKGDCFHCHGVYPYMTENDFMDNGLQGGGYVDLGLGGFNGIATDNGKMKIPPLRNLSYTAPYMHDGRFATLDEVIDYYSEGVNHTANISPLMKKVNQGGLHLSTNKMYILPSGDTLYINEKEALKAFLLTLDDPAFIENPEYQSPF